MGSAEDILILVLQKRGVFVDRAVGGIIYMELHQLSLRFCDFLRINLHNFAKNHLILRTNGLFYAKFYEAL